MTDTNKNLKVIGAGFGRTGTLSMQGALQQLGFGPCYHMKAVFENPPHANLWAEAYDQKESYDYERILKDFRAAVDWPACTFYKELANQYPDAKVILTVRSSADAWYKSACETIYSVRRLPVPQTPMIEKIIWTGTFDNNFDDAEFAKRIYCEHIENVKAAIPPERLLVFCVSEGWGPLCKFLNVPVPETPFPHLNDTEDFKKLITMMSQENKSKSE